MKLLCDAHNFRIALNYHCYGNLLIYPWGYNDQPTADHQIFTAMSEAMTRENNFFAGLGGSTVGYPVNGDSDDWMYGENVSKPAIFSMTPEVGPGSFGFWPPQSAIDELNKSCMFQNLTTAHLLLNYGIAKETNPQPIVNNLTDDIELELEKLGLMNGSLTLAVTPVTGNVVVNTGQQTLNLPAWSKDSITFNYTIDNSTVPGDSIVFEVALDNGLYIFRDTIVRVFGIMLHEIYFEDGTDLNEWQTTSTWGTTTEEFVSAPSCVSDSPFADYNHNRFDFIQLTTVIDLTNATVAEASFFAKWDIESNYDYVQFEAAPVNGSFTALCGLYTEPGENTQPAGPVYDGVQQSWVKETVSLNDYLGDQVKFRFTFVSDNYVNSDGFYFDDFSIKSDQIIISETEETTTTTLQLLLQPNPAEELVTLTLSQEQVNPKATINIYNGLGQTVFNRSFSGFSQHQLDVADWAPGLYLVEYQSGDQTIVEKLLVH